MPDETGPYRVAEEEDDYRVMSPSGMTVMACRDGASAQHYATLMNQAYRAGYKAGYREGKGSARK